MVGLLTIMLVPAAGVDMQTAEMEGCPDLSKLTAAAQQLVHDWDQATPESVAEQWPDEVRALETPRPDGSGLFGTRGRVIKSQCQCCESFQFDASERKSGGHRPRLSGFNVFYSTRSKATAAAAAKELATAILNGAGKHDLIARMDASGNGRVDWEDSSQGTLAWVESRLVQSSSTLWTLHVSMTVAPIR
jgi:hypothetical protein